MSIFHTQNPASLCGRCAVVSFADGEFNGFKRVAIGDREYLGYELPPKQDDGDEDFEFRLDFDLDDAFPLLPELTQGATNGCDFCAYLKVLLLSDEVQCRLSDMIPNREERKLPVSIFLYYRWGTWLFYESEGLDSLVIGLYVDTRDFETIDNMDALEMEIILSVGSDGNQNPADDACANWLSLWPSVQTNHLTEKKMKWMESHIRDCSEGLHSAKCYSPENNFSSLPTRLLDVTGPVLRLVHGEAVMSEATRNGMPIPKYAALSYCWGLDSHANDQLKTETALEEQMHTEIPIRFLTRTIRDAVQLAQAFQIPYLWVDSLCIIQDDISDWERESSRMGTIYSNAFVTFCSPGSTCHTSFLQPPSPTILIPFQSQLHGEVKGAYVLRYSTCAMGRANSYRFVTDVANSRWLRRGWAHQEYVMSARLLIFGPHFVHFLCPSLTASEREPPETWQWQFLLRGVSNNKQELYNEWGKSIAPIYSDRQFSKPEDVLPAISGLASYFSKALGDEYIAGLWKKDMMRGLVWSYCRYPGPPFFTMDDLLGNLSQPNGYIAPSWSWIGKRIIDLSLYAHVEDSYEDFEQRCEIQAVVDVQGQNIFGRISDSQIRVTSPTLIFSHTDTSQERLDRRCFNVKLQDGTMLFCTPDWANGRMEGQFKLLVLGSVDWAQSRGAVNAPKMVKMVTGAMEADTDSNTPDIDVYGLLLHAAPKDGQFYRVGVFNSYSRQGGGMQLLDHCETETICVI